MTTERNKVKQLLPLLTAGLLILGGLTGLNSVIGSDHWDPEPDPDPASDRFLLDIADFEQASAYGAWNNDEDHQTSKAVAFGAGARPLMNTHTQDLRDVVYRVKMTAPDNAEIGFVGLVLHHQAPTSQGDDYDTIIVDWMSGDNNPPTGYNATEGLTMYHIEGTVPDNDADMLACFWEKDDTTCPADIDILATQQGSNTGWVPGEEYEFRVNFRGDNFPTQSGIKFDIRTDNESSPYWTAFPDTFKDVLQMGHYELEPAQFGYYTFRQGAAVFSNATFSDHIKPDLEVDSACLDIAPEGGCLGPYEVEVTSVTDLGSGVANVTCKINGDPLFDCDIAPFQVDDHGAYNVLVEAFDHAGNRAFQTRSFVIDQEAPVVSAGIDCLGDVVGGFCNGNGQLDVSASALSGIDSLVCGLDSGNGTQSVACNAVIDEDGDHTITANATSNVGFSTEASATFLRDATAPDGVIVEPTPGCIYQDGEPTLCAGTTIVSGNLTFNVLGQDPSVNDVSAGMDRVEFYVDGEEFANISGDGDDGWYNATWSPDGEGERTVEVLLIDNAGNVEVLEFEALVLPLGFVPGIPDAPEAPDATLPGLPTDNRQAALDGADRLLDLQFESGAFPWDIESPAEHQNVQGATAIGLLDAYTLSLDEGYLANATANRDWLVNHTEQGGLHSAPSFYFLAKYALLSGNLDDLEFARGILQERLDAYGNATALAEFILNFRNNSVHTNMGVWDVALYVRGAHDVGMTNVSAEFADVLAEQTTEDGIVDAFNETNSWYTLGLSGLLFGLSEGDALGHDSVIQEASDRLLATQCEDGSFEEVFAGESFCSSVQTTAYSVIGLQHALADPLAAFAGCDFIRAAQNETTGGWPYSDGTEYAIVDSEAVQALAACVAPVHNAATSYADGPVVGNLPLGQAPEAPDAPTGPSPSGTPDENRASSLAGADRLLDVQFESGAFPWVVGIPTEFQNVQGATAIGLLDAYTLSLDDGYLVGAEANRDWLVNHTEQGGLHSAPSFYFLAKYALLSGNLDDLEFARGILQERLDAYDNATALGENVVETRKNQGHTNLGVWDLAFYVRAAHDVGMTNVSAEFADVLAQQTNENGIVDAFNETNNWYTMGLSGVLFGLSEADYLGHEDVISEASDRLLDMQCEDGSFAYVYGGGQACGDPQTTAYGVIGLQHALADPLAAFAGCDYLRAAQNETTGGWPYSDGTEYPVVNSEVVQALAACVVPVHNAATSYADGPVAGNLPLGMD